MATKAKGKGRQPPRRAAARATTKSRTGVKPPERPRRRPARAPEPAREALPGPEPDAVALSAPEPTFAARVPPPGPEASRAAARRAIFLDVENTSRPQHLTHVIDHLAVDRHQWQTELVAVANWKVVGHDSARLLAKAGAHLVHSAPLTGVRDWSDLRIAVAAGIWLASARQGDEIVALVQELVAASPTRRISIDTLANALKGRGFQRTSGSPRLMTRLRRIRQIAVSASGAITLATGDADGSEPPPEPSDVQPGDVDGPEPAGEEPRDGSAALPVPRRGRRRRRRRRGGGHRPAAQPAPAG